MIEREHEHVPFPGDALGGGCYGPCMICGARIGRVEPSQPWVLVESSDELVRRRDAVILYALEWADSGADDPLLHEVEVDLVDAVGRLKRGRAYDGEPVVTEVGPDQQDRAHELAQEHARKVADALGTPEQIDRTLDEGF